MIVSAHSHAFIDWPLNFLNEKMFLGSYLIIGVSVLFLVGVVVTYVMAGSKEHIPFLWSFISYAGNFPVESCIFSAVFNMCSALYFLIVILKYNQIYNAMEGSTLSEKAYNRMKSLNFSSLVLGLIGSAGLSITGSFQQRSVHFMHMLGVVCCTCGTTAFLIFQTYFSFTLTSSKTKKFLKIFRLLIVILIVIVFVSGAIMVLYFFIRNPKWFGVMRATMGERTDLFKTGIIMEWVLFFLIQLFVYSFYPDFKNIRLEKNRISFLD